MKVELEKTQSYLGDVGTGYNITFDISNTFYGFLKMPYEFNDLLNTGEFRNSLDT